MTGTFVHVQLCFRLHSHQLSFSTMTNTCIFRCSVSFIWCHRTSQPPPYKIQLTTWTHPEELHAHTDTHTQWPDNTDPSSLSVHMCGSDVFGQVGAAGKQQLAVIPAACVAQRLAPRRRWAAPRNCTSTMTVEHGRGGATAGRSALHVHQGAADTGEEGRR